MFQSITGLTSLCNMVFYHQQKLLKKVWFCICCQLPPSENVQLSENTLKPSLLNLEANYLCC